MEKVKFYSLPVKLPMKPDMGPWQLNDEGDGIHHIENGYDIEFAECQTSAQVLDWLMQVAGKQWADDKTLAGLVRAFDHHLNPQSTLCGSGIERGPVNWATKTIAY